MKISSVFNLAVLLGCTIVICFGTSQDAFAANRKQKICLSEDGQLAVKKKCKSSETTLSLQGLTTSLGTAGVAGPEGPQGVAGPKGDTGAQGEQGPTGPQGPQGAQGEAGIAGSMELTPVYAVYNNVSIDAGTSYLAFGGFCPTGQYSIAGSCKISDNSGLTLVYHSVNAPQLDNHFSYRCVWRNDTGSTIIEPTIEIKHFCVPIP